MRIIFIRHGDPDYEHDSLTEKGWREAALLAERVSGWQVTDFYVSPLGRARDTASLSLQKTGRTARTLPWLREFHAPINDPARGEGVIPWDFYPAFWTKEEGMYDREGFADTPVMRTGSVKEEFLRVSAGLDSLLADYGYVREGKTPAELAGILQTMDLEPAVFEALCEVLFSTERVQLGLPVVGFTVSGGAI